MNEALVDLTWLIDEFPDTSQAYQLRAHVYRSLGEDEAAAADMQQATRHSQLDNAIPARQK